MYSEASTNAQIDGFIYIYIYIYLFDYFNNSSHIFFHIYSTITIYIIITYLYIFVCDIKIKQMLKSFACILMVYSNLKVKTPTKFKSKNENL